MNYYLRLLIVSGFLLFGTKPGIAEVFEKVPVLQGLDGAVYHLDDGRTAEIYVVHKLKNEAYDLTRVNLETGERLIVLPNFETKPGWRLLAIDQRFVVASTRGAAQFFGLQVLDRQTGKEVAARLVGDAAVAGSIRDGKLTLIQNSRKGLVRAIFDLKTLEFEEEVGSNATGTYSLITGDPLSLIVCGRSRLAGAYEYGVWEVDYDLELLDSVPTPIHPTTNFAACNAGAVKNSDTLYTLMKNQIHAVDFNTKDVRFITSPLENVRFHRIAVRSGLLFAAQGEFRGQDKLIRVFDGNTGQELTTLPIIAGNMFFAGDFLVTSNRVPGKYSASGENVRKTVVYSFDWQGLRDRDAAIDKVRNAFRSAKQVIAAGGNHYDALPIFEKESVAPVLDSLADLALQDRRMVAEYAIWLSMAFGRATEGLELLEQIDISGSDPLLDPKVIVAARHRAELLEYPPNSAVAGIGGTEAEGRKEDGRGLVSRAVSFSRAMDFGSFPDQIYADGDKFLIASWTGGSTTIEVFDRQSLEWLQQIFIQASDGERQESITSVAFTEGKVLVATGNRYPRPDDINLFVLDRETLEIIGQHGFANGPKLVSDEASPLACDRFYSNNCTTVDLEKFERIEADVNRSLVKAQSPVSGRTLKELIELGRREQLKNATIVALGRKYAAKNISTKRNVRRFVLVDLDTGAESPVEGSYARLARIFFSPDGAAVGLVKYDIASVTFLAIDPVSGRTRTLIRVPKVKGERASITYALTDRNLFIAIGPDVAVLDFELGELLEYEPDFVRRQHAGQRNVRIDRLLLDGERLLAIPFYGGGASRYTRNVQVIDLARLESLLTEGSSRLRQSANVLAQTLRGFQ